MDAFAVPGDVVDALAAVGYRATATVGGSAWLALPVAAGGGGAIGGPVEVHAVPVALDPVTTARVEALLGLRHPHLPLVHAVLPLAAGRLGLVVEHVEGTALARLRAARAPLADGEAATIAIPVARALGALHARGLAHGAVRGEAIVVRPDGRPVLVDLRGALEGGGSGDGDLRRLLTTVLDAMPGADVDLLAAAADGGGAPTVRDAIEQLLVSPLLDADAVEAGWFEAVEPEPVRLPDLGALAGSELAEIGRAAPTDLGPRRHRRPGRAGARRRKALRAVLVPLGVLAVGAGVAGVAVGLRGTAGPGATGAPDRVVPGLPVVAQQPAVEPSSADDAVAAAVRLTRERARVLASVDPGALREVDAPGGPALLADTRLLDDLHARALEGLAVDVRAERVDGPVEHAVGPVGDAADVLVTTTTSGYVRVAPDGARTPVPATSPTTVVLGLRRTSDGWRVWDVRSP